MAYSIYKSYYDRYYQSSPKLPKTTTSWRVKKQKRKSNDNENTITEKISKVKTYETYIISINCKINTFCKTCLKNAY